jgi:putative phage-type endonuclease
MEQKTSEWFEARCGSVTASRIADVMARTKAGYGAGRKNYMAQLVVERLTGEVAESFTNSAMEWGTATEPMAREAYETATGTFVIEDGFRLHPEIPRTGASPDGLVGEQGMIEIKAPNTATHIDTLLSQTIPRKYVLQMHWQMEVYGREWNDFVSYDPRLPEGLQLFIKRVELDQKLMAEIRTEVQLFLLELDEKIVELEKLK